MKNLIKINVILLFLLLNLESQAQLSLNFGLNRSNLTYEDDFTEPQSDVKNGIQLGLTYNIKLSDNVSLDPGIKYSQKGSNTHNFIGNTLEYRLNYLDIDLKTRYNLKFGEFKVYGFMGPYLSYGLSGETIFGATSSKNDIKFGDDKDYDDLKQIVVGLELGVGANFKNVKLELGYENDFTNSYHQSPFSSVVLKNKNFKVSIGYIFISNKENKRYIKSSVDTLNLKNDNEVEEENVFNGVKNNESRAVKNLRDTAQVKQTEVVNKGEICDLCSGVGSNLFKCESIRCIEGIVEDSCNVCKGDFQGGDADCFVCEGIGCNYCDYDGKCCNECKRGKMKKNHTICNGTGNIKVVCNKCNGKGIIKEE